MNPIQQAIEQATAARDWLPTICGELSGLDVPEDDANMRAAIAGLERVEGEIDAALTSLRSLNKEVEGVLPPLPRDTDECNALWDHVYEYTHMAEGVHQRLEAVCKAYARTALAQPQQVPKVHAYFVYEQRMLKGSTYAPVKRVSVNDDGSLSVEIDYWPEAVPQGRK